MAILTKMLSTTCATVSPATSSGVTRRITREESRPGTTPCPLGGVASPSGKRMSTQSDAVKGTTALPGGMLYSPLISPWSSGNNDQKIIDDIM